MEQRKKPGRGAAAKDGEAARGGNEKEPVTPHAHLIRIADSAARQRAIVLLGEAREPYCGFTDYRLLVTNEHLEVLKREAIPFEVLS
jgi:hypothetical protein